MIIVKNRELLIPENERYIGTSYDTETENRQFRLEKFAQNGVDLSALTFRLDLKYENDGLDTVLLTKEVFENYFVLTWTITKNTLKVPGTVFIGLRAIDDEATVRWASYTAAVYVDRHLNTPGAYTGDLTELEQIEQDHVYMLSVVNELKDNLDYKHAAEAWAIGKRNGEAVETTDETYHNNSKYYSQQAGSSATAAANSAAAAAGSATQAAATVEDTNTRFNNAINAMTQETEVVDARVGADAIVYSTLKGRLDAENTDLKNALSASNSIHIEIGRYSQTRKARAEISDAKNCFALLIPCRDESTEVRYIVGYPYMVHLYGRALNLISSDQDWNSASKTVSNAGGYMTIVYSKNPWADFTQDDVDFLKEQLAFYVDDGLEVENTLGNYSAIKMTLGTYNASARTTYSDNNTRCFSSLVPCTKDVVVIPSHSLYPFIVHTYDSHYTLISSDADWNMENRYIENKGGYIAIEVYKKPWGSEITNDDLKEIENNIFVPDPVFTIGVWNMSRKNIDANTRRCTSYLINCVDDTTIIPYIPGYPYFYWVYDKNMNLIERHDNLSTCYSTKFHNKNGYIVVAYQKAFGDTFDEDDATFITSHFSIKNEEDAIRDELRKKYVYGTAYRVSPQNKRCSVEQSGSPERCFSSMIYCAQKSMIVPHIPGYKHVIYLFDQNEDYIACYPSNEQFVSGTHNVENEGGFISIVWAKDDGVFTDADVESIRKAIVSNSYVNPVMQRENYSTPILTIIDDDGRVGFPDEADMLEDHGVTGTFAVISDFADGTHNNYMNLSQILNLRDRGFDAVSHTASHSTGIYGNNYSAGRYCNFSMVSDETVAADLKRSRDFLLKYGLNADAIIWPWGNYPTGYNIHTNNPDPEDPLVIGADNQRLRYTKIAQNVGFKYGANSTGGLVLSSDFDDMWIPRVPMMADNTNYPLSYYTAMLNKTKERGGWFILMTHASDPLYADLQKLTDVVEYALNNGIQILNFKEAYQIKRHSVSIGLGLNPYHHFYVGCDGVIHF